MKVIGKTVVVSCLNLYGMSNSTKMHRSKWSNALARCIEPRELIQRREKRCGGNLRTEDRGKDGKESVDTAGPVNLNSRLSTQRSEGYLLSVSKYVFVR